MPERPEGCCAQKVPVPFLPRRRGLLLMKWFGGVLLILVLALILQAGLLAYAMYVLLGLMVVSRFLARERTGPIVFTGMFRAALISSYVRPSR